MKNIYAHEKTNLDFFKLPKNMHGGRSSNNIIRHNCWREFKTI